MAITYTDNFGFPLLESGSNGWDAALNGALEAIDLHLWQNRNPSISIDGTLMVSYLQRNVVLRYQA